MTLYNRIISVVTSILISIYASGVLAQDLRVESQVFVEGTETPVSENLTLFNGQITYDFQFAKDNSKQFTEIVIFDLRTRQFVLLDLERELRTDIAEFQLLKMVENLRGVAEVNEDTNFLLNPEFETEVDHDKGIVTLSNDDMTYQATGSQPGNTADLGSYFDSMDQLTRLSASDPSRLPPFPRLALNQEIQRNGLFPSEIEVRYRAGTISKEEFQAKSKHTAGWELSDEDQVRIKKAKIHWMQFERVSLATYRGIEEQAAKN